MHPAPAIAALWLFWVVSWLAAAFWADPAAKRAGFREEARYRALWTIGAILLFVPAHGYVGRLRLWMPTLTEAWICVALVAVGLAFSWWARLHLGQLWSGTVTAKADHRVVDTGPYRLVRHPIYTGLLVAILATMAAKGTVWGVAGAAFLIVGIVVKARLEESFLRGELGTAYDDYARRVPMLLPFAPNLAPKCV
ncbi:isoprenylcysteine carboxylmethyltransferase family protein [Mesorhizobium sp. M4B.F.Ca.ET.215.01.1.1]|uniref:methyltransferase family protein n=1 Tax=unclassified Mesorhizobium TaxID=325217 RepID=UPI000FCAE2A6|nr:MULTISPECIES: isoprenylcysteine carboxylmethyltransferase family protein [unclassified Mesorhizobium]RUW23971.1 isoprenylcysteine carboxylmethyltransferase family protein [Mesorhizobium sp. M4B.F.Ca.ET.013.02.1.1]RVD43050.1 isoprenylcysteine carboxylmethyltransferase family protein [Mesorhizobium sp. M4B.F.Ca.ET.019.03.1.1]RWF64742.1 MAG: isoprenylcysteine carboxylmethyltransferase family protein [Mesorhizobium sp.]TGQ11011.1 isoprenylcysteine carboxylmethyltransferase family protein [Mesorh